MSCASRIPAAMLIGVAAALLFAGPVAAQDGGTTEPPAPVVDLPDVVESAETAQAPTTLPPTTTVLLAPPVTTIQISAPAVTTTVPLQVLAEQEANELAVTGIDAGVLLGIAVGLLLAGGGLGYLVRRDDGSN